MNSIRFKGKTLRSRGFPILNYLVINDIVLLFHCQVRFSNLRRLNVSGEGGRRHMESAGLILSSFKLGEK